jgi:mono/diheme cytochrome c family protein
VHGHQAPRNEVAIADTSHCVTNPKRLRGSYDRLQRMRAFVRSARRPKGTELAVAAIHTKEPQMSIRSLWFVLLVATACAKSNSAAQGDVAKGEEIFAQRCVLCHGSTGHGDGPASISLDPKPRQFADHA